MSGGTSEEDPTRHTKCNNNKIDYYYYKWMDGYDFKWMCGLHGGDINLMQSEYISKGKSDSLPINVTAMFWKCSCKLLQLDGDLSLARDRPVANWQHQTPVHNNSKDISELWERETHTNNRHDGFSKKVCILLFAIYRACREKRTFSKWSKGKHNNNIHYCHTHSSNKSGNRQLSVKFKTKNFIL